MKPLVYFLFLALFFLSVGCEKELKEHKVPPQLKKQLKQMEKRNSPEFIAKEISGEMTIDPKITSRISNSSSLFLFVRPEGQTKGPPLAVKRYGPVIFPFKFTIGPADVMIDGLDFSGTFTLSARLDQDGSAMSAPGDAEGRMTVQAGQKDVELVIDSVIEPGPGSQIKGVITVDDKLKIPNAAEGGEVVLFLIARKANSPRGAPPLAVKRLEDISYPYNFTLGPKDVMVPGTLFAGKVHIKARIDQDGDAMTAPGDIEGKVEATVGDESVEILIDTLR